MERLGLVRMQPLPWNKKQSYKSRARDLDLEHTTDAGSPGDHRVQAWSHSSRSRSDLRKKFTYGRTDRQTTDAARLY